MNRVCAFLLYFTAQLSLFLGPVLSSPVNIKQDFTFIPNPQDGQLYILGDGRLSKLPFTIPQLVKASPCRSSDGLLYAGTLILRTSNGNFLFRQQERRVDAGKPRDRCAFGGSATTERRQQLLPVGAGNDLCRTHGVPVVHGRHQATRQAVERYVH